MAIQLESMGYNKIGALLGGLSAWRNAGLPIEIDGTPRPPAEVAQQAPENLPPPLLPRRDATPPPAASAPFVNTPSRSEIDATRRIGPEEAWELVQSGQAIIVDVRNKDAFDFQHIKGSKTLPLAELPNRARNELSPTRWIIPYCT